MKILVTGPDGVLGSNVVRELLSRNYEVSVMLMDAAAKTPTLDGLAIERFYGNILNPEDLDAAFKGQEVVIHCAASTSVYPARDAFVNKVNIEGSENVIDACIKHEIKRLIYVGTANSHGYGDAKEPGKEGNPYTSIKYGLDYMDSKRKAQEIILDAVTTKGLPALVVNPTFMIGPYDSKPSSGAMIIAVHQGKVPGYTKGGKNFVAVKDAAVAISNAVTMGRIGESYILGNENLSFHEAFDMIAETIGAKKIKIGLPNFIVKGYGAATSFFAKLFKFTPAVTKELAIISCDTHYYSSEKARKEIGLPATPVKEAVAECYAWFKENGYLDKK
jgi:dihydroflavonol-4-reductase